MAQPTLLTVILNYRTAQMTQRATEAALREMEGIPGALVIVDNASGDGSCEALATMAACRGWTEGGRVRVIASPRNGGFGAGCNIGIRARLPDGTAPDYVYLLNSDAFPGPGAIRRLLAHLEANPRTGLAGSYIHGTDGAPHHTAFRFPSIASEFEGAARTGPVSRWFKHRIVALPLPETTRTVDWTAGASLMLRHTMLEEVGLFDEAFFLYFEETDLCRRARNAGWATDYVRDSAVAHVGSASTGMKKWQRIPDYWLDSRMHYFVKTHGAGYAAAATAAHLAGGALWQLRRLVSRRPHTGPEGFLRDLMFHAPGWLGAHVLSRRSPARPPRDTVGETE